jgi:hypothetical protein
MKEEITQIVNQVSNRTISTDEAIDDLLRLFDVTRRSSNEIYLAAKEYATKIYSETDYEDAKYHLKYAFQAGADFVRNGG